MNGHWKTKIKLDDDIIANNCGFVYAIQNNKTQRTYFGQKVFHNKIKRPPLKGKKRVRRDTKTSNWKTYTGSSTALNEDISALGIENFSFEILSIHDTKWDMNYNELKHIVLNDAIPNNMFYNKFLGKIGKCPNSSKY